MLLIFLTPPLAVMGQEQYEYSYTFTKKVFDANNQTKTLESVDWTFNGTGGDFFGYDATKGQQFGSGSNPYSEFTFSTSGISGTVTEIKVNTSGAKDISGTLNVTVGENVFGNQYTLTASAAEVTFSGSATGAIALKYTQTSSKAIYIKSISITYTSGGTQPSTYSVTYNANGATSGTVPTDNTEYDDTNNTVTVLGNTGSLAKTGYTWSGWNTKADGTGTSYVAGDTFTISANTTLYAKWTVNTHNITMPDADTYGSYTASATTSVAYGTTVTLTYVPATGYYSYAATWSVNGTSIVGNTFVMPDETVTVAVAVADATSWTYTHAANDGNGSTSGTWIYIEDYRFTVQQTKSGTTDIVTNNSDLRLYQNHYLEIFPNVSLGKRITSIEFICTSNNYGTALGSSTFIAGESSSNTNSISASNITTSETKVTVSLTDVVNCAYLKVTAGAQARISSITVNYADPVVVTYYNINYSTSLTNGTFATGNPTTAAEGATVTVTTTPDAGYHLASMTYIDGNDHAAAVSGNTGTFTMPDAAVTVSATFALNVATFTDGIYSETMMTQASFNNMTVIDYEGSQTWGFNSNGYAVINGYASGANANQDWLITPRMAVENGKLDIAFQSYHNDYASGQFSVKWATALDGTWVDATFTEGDANTWNDHSFTITTTASNVYVAFVYVSTTSEAGAWEIRNFTAKRYYSITVSTVVNGEITAVPDDFQVVGGEVLVGATASTGCHFVSWNITPAVTVENDEFIMPAGNVTISATFEQDVTCTITFNENGVEISDNITSGPIGSNLPSTPFGNVPANLTFAGWSTASIATYTDVAPTLVDANYVVNGNVTFYAVYAYAYSYTTGSSVVTWEKVTDASALAAGDQLVIASDSKDKVAGNISSDFMSVVDATFSDGVMGSLPSTAVVLTLGGTSGAWTLANASNQLLGATAVKKLAWGSGTTTWSISISDGNATIQNGTNDYGRFLHNVSNTRFTTYTSKANTSMLLPQLYRRKGGTSTVSGTYYLTSVVEIATSTTIAANSTTTLTNNVTIDDTNGSYTVNGTLDANGHLILNQEPDRLLVNDGGQLVTSSAVNATMKKIITAYTSSKDATSDGWYFIASPLTTSTAPTAVGNLVAATLEDYDLYQLNPSTIKWENYKENAGNAAPDFNLENGRGYLYANKEQKTLEFAGAIKPYSEESSANQVSVSEGWNLIGNPFTCNVYANCAFYKMNATKTAVEAVSAYGSTPIAPCTGIVVNADETGTVTFSKTEPDGVSNNGALNVVLAKQVTDRGGVSTGSTTAIDKAIVSFNRDSQLGKFYFGTQDANLYLPQSGKEFAIVNADSYGELPLNFLPNESGAYTLSVDPEGVEMNYLHLIDNLTGADTDLLRQSEYCFTATRGDYPSRFRLVFSANTHAGDDSHNDFAFVSDGDIIVTGDTHDATLQVVDVTGRTLLRANGANRVSTNGMAPGVYVLQLLQGEQMRTQKIVVK